MHTAATINNMNECKLHAFFVDLDSSLADSMPFVQIIAPRFVCNSFSCRLVESSPWNYHGSGSSAAAEIAHLPPGHLPSKEFHPSKLP